MPKIAERNLSREFAMSTNGGNPYTAPEADIRPAMAEKPLPHVLRATTLRLAGLLCLTLAISAILAEAYMLFSEHPDPIRETARRSRMADSCIVLITIFAAVTNWGIFRLKFWGQMALTVAIAATIILHMIIVVNSIVLRSTNITPPFLMNMLRYFTTLAISQTPILYGLWSAKSRMAFSRNPYFIRPGLLAIIAAVGFVASQLICFLILAALLEQMASGDLVFD